MSLANLDVVNQWRSADLSDRSALSDVIDEEVEWVVTERGQPRTLRGIDAVVAWYREPQEQGGPENLNVTEERGELEDLGDGRVAGITRLVFTWKESGDVAYVKAGRLVYTIRDGKITRCVREVLPDEPS